MPPQVDSPDVIGSLLSGLDTGTPSAPDVNASPASAVAAVDPSIGAEYGTSSTDDLNSAYANAKNSLARLNAEYANAPSINSLSIQQKLRGGTRTKEEIAGEIKNARDTMTRVQAEVNRRTAAGNRRPTAQIPTGAIPAMKETQKTISSKIAQARAAGVDDATIKAVYGPWLDENGQVTASSVIGGSGGSSSIAEAGRNLRAQLQNALQTKKLGLATAKAISKDYFDALQEARQREYLSQEALQTAQQAQSDVLTTEREKMRSLVTPQNLRMWADLANELNRTSGSSFRIPDEYVNSLAPVQISPDVLGPNLAEAQTRNIGNAVQEWGRTPEQINSRVLAAPSNGAQPAATSVASFIAGGGGDLNNTFDSFIRNASPQELQAVLNSLGSDNTGSDTTDTEE